MYSIETIKSMNRETAKKARGKKPYIAVCNQDGGVFKCPDFGDYRPKGWQLVEQYFVDNSGFGAENESALTPGQFLSKVKADYGYVIIETGQFQVYIGEFIKL